MLWWLSSEIIFTRFIAQYFTSKGEEVYVLNRNTKPQPDGVTLIEKDRHDIGDALKDIHFDLVIDNGYTKEDVADLLDALGSFDDYVLISSSAVYPDNLPQPFTEETTVGENKFWGIYGTNKIEAEKYLQANRPDAYIVRPPYLYGPMNNVYRESFVFDCAKEGREFLLPGNGDLKLQFFHVEDLCRVIDEIIKVKPDTHIFNVGNKEQVTVKEWVTMCYQTAGKEPTFRNVNEDIHIRKYFCFSDYEYYLDVTKQEKLIKVTKSFEEGLKESFEWYKDNEDKVNKRDYLHFLKNYL